MLKCNALTRKQRLTLLSLILVIVATLTYAALRNNFHTVIPHEVYRSAQLSPSSLKHVVRLKQIKTIVNLRGENPQTTWYRQEIALSHALHLMHNDIALNSKQLPTHKQLITLKNILLNSPKPILLHCKSGVDRSGFASAMALILLKDTPLPEAMNQFSWHYFVTSKRSIGHLVFNNYQQWLTKHNKPGNKASFLQWVEMRRLE